MLEDWLSKPEARETLDKFYTAKEEVKHTKVEMILTAPILNENEAEELGKRQCRTVEQQASLAKYWLMHNCGLKAEEMTAGWIEWYQGDGRQAIRNYQDQFILPKAALEWH